MSENYIQNTLREVDPDRYLVSLFAPKDRQEALWSLFLFNHEISKTRFIVTETQLGLIRLQWWREELVKLYAGERAPDNPVLEGLEIAIRDYGLPKALFDNLLFAREFDLEGVTPQGFEGLVNYADLTTTPLNKLALQITGNDPADEHIQKISIRYALTQLYRLIPAYKAQNFTVIPKELYVEVQDYLMNQMKFMLDAPVLKSQNVLSNIYLKQLKKVQFDANDPKLNKPPIFKELRVALSVSYL